MTPDDEVEFNCQLLNGVDPLTALAALPAEPAADPEPQSPSAAHQWGVLAGVVAVLVVVVLWASL